MGSRLVLVAVFLSVSWLTSAQANAFCRTNTCDADPNTAGCTYAANGCLTGGAELYWNRSCLSFSVNADGSPKRGISYEEAQSAISKAMFRWISVECPDGGSPGLALDPYPAVTCSSIQYNKTGPNANAWVFRDDGWPYESIDQATTLALTTVTFNARSGEILDADVEVNSFNNLLTAQDQSDLLAVATHESGHVLGLAHSTVDGSVMGPFYSEEMVDGVSLATDDVAAICDAYPAANVSQTCNADPEGGFTPECSESVNSGCSVARPASGPSPSATGLLFASMAVLLRRRRR